MNKTGIFILIFIVINIFIFSLDKNLDQIDYVLIVNKDNSLENMSSDNIKDIFLGNMIKWDNKERIEVIIYRNKEMLETFFKKYLNMNYMKFNFYWKKMIFTGKGIPPVNLSEVSSVYKRVEENIFSIGIVRKDDVLIKNSNIKVIHIQDSLDNDAI